jgi:UTP:GlnB (protein PII) uridylyltransferase
MLENDAPLHELEWRGLITGDNIADLDAAREFFLKLRVWLHLTTGKKNDMLRVEWQDDCARAFAFTGSGALASQRLLREYYRHAERASRALERVLRSLLVGPLPLDGHFVADRRRLRSRRSTAFRSTRNSISPSKKRCRISTTARAATKSRARRFALCCSIPTARAWRSRTCARAEYSAL